MRKELKNCFFLLCLCRLPAAHIGEQKIMKEISLYTCHKSAVNTHSHHEYSQSLPSLCTLSSTAADGEFSALFPVDSAIVFTITSIFTSETILLHCCPPTYTNYAHFTTFFFITVELSNSLS